MIGVAIVFVYCLCCRSSDSSDEEKGMILRMSRLVCIAHAVSYHIAGWPSLRKHKGMMQSIIVS